MEQYILELKNVSLIYDGGSGTANKALDNVNLKIEAGDYITVVGGNGQGKSSLLKVIAELYPTRGNVFCDGKDISRTPHHERAKYIRCVTQNTFDIVADSVNLAEQFSQAQNLRSWLSLRKAVTRNKHKLIKQKLAELDLGLEDRLNDSLNCFSGGERQALALAMAISTKPDILLLDEHTAALDFKNMSRIEKITDEMIKNNSLTALWVTHNIEQAMKYGNRILIISRGQIAFDIKDVQRTAMTKHELIGLIEASLSEIDK